MGDGPTIIFVCVHNAGRSQMAAAFMRQRAAGKVRALSAGTQPGDHVHPEVVAVMHELGIDLSSDRPQLLTPELAADADRLISMGCAVEEACPALRIPMEDWALEDPKGKPLDRVREIRDDIRRRVDALAAELLPSP
jgi:arsenate reductase